MKLDSLTSLRFFAALMVVLSHLSYLGDSQSQILSSIYDNFFSEGYIGVTFFFILSGFVLAYSYANKYERSRFYYGQFYVLRIIRIYPLHLLTLIISIPLIDISIDVFPNIFLIQSFFSNSNVYFYANAPSWSLSVEMFFYLLFPFIVRLRMGWLFLVLLFSASAKIYMGVVLESPKEQHYYLYISPYFRLLDFVMGIFLCKVFLELKVSAQCASFFQFIALLVLIFFISLKDCVPQYLRFDLYYVLPMSLVVLSFSFSDGFFSKALSGKTLIILGESSFALYLIHQLVIRFSLGQAGWFPNLMNVMGEGFYSMFVLILSISLSVFVYFYFERIVSKYLRNRIL